MVGSPVRLSELDVESHIALVWQPTQQKNKIKNEHKLCFIITDM